MSGTEALHAYFVVSALGVIADGTKGRTVEESILRFLGTQPRKRRHLRWSEWQKMGYAVKQFEVLSWMNPKTQKVEYSRQAKSAP